MIKLKKEIYNLFKTKTMELKQTDEQQFIENSIFNIKYLIRDVLTYKQLLIIREFLTEIIDEKVSNGYTEN
jgi:hypothetical protein